MLSKGTQILGENIQDNSNNIKVNAQNYATFPVVTYIWSKNVHENIKHQIQGTVFIWDGKVTSRASPLSENISFLQNSWGWVMGSRVFIVLCSFLLGWNSHNSF